MNQQQAHTLPEGWEWKRLDKIIAELESGASLNSYDKTIDEGEIGILKVSAVSGCKFSPSEHKTITEKEIHLARVNPRKGSIIISRSNTPELVGHSAYVHQDFPNLYLPDKLWQTVLHKDSEVDVIWLSQIIASEDMLRRISSTATGSSGSMKNISKGAFLSFSVLSPPLPEQQQIAAVLSTWDRAIEQTNTLLGQLRTRHRGLMQRLLTGKVRLPGFAGEWRHVEFSDVFERVNRRNSEGNTNVLTISAQQGLVSQGRYFNKSIASEDVANYFLLHKGEFAYNKSYSAGYPMGAMKRLEQFEKGILSPLYICFRVLNEIDNDATFFTHYFEGGYMNRAISEIAQEGARNHGLLNVGVNDFFGLRLVIPTVEEQQAIAAVLDTSLREIRQQEARLSSLREQKRGLMQNLLTGKVRVPLPAEVA